MTSAIARLFFRVSRRGSGGTLAVPGSMASVRKLNVAGERAVRSGLDKRWQQGDSAAAKVEAELCRLGPIEDIRVQAVDDRPTFLLAVHHFRPAQDLQVVRNHNHARIEQAGQ